MNLVQCMGGRKKQYKKKKVVVNPAPAPSTIIPLNHPLESQKRDYFILNSDGSVSFYICPSLSFSFAQDLTPRHVRGGGWIFTPPVHPVKNWTLEDFQTTETLSDVESEISPLSPCPENSDEEEDEEEEDVPSSSPISSPLEPLFSFSEPLPFSKEEDFHHFFSEEFFHGFEQN